MYYVYYVQIVYLYNVYTKEKEVDYVLCVLYTHCIPVLCVH